MAEDSAVTSHVSMELGDCQMPGLWSCALQMPMTWVRGRAAWKLTQARSTSLALNLTVSTTW